MRGILQSLNENAGAIQAIATAALLLITGWYTRLTYRPVKVQEAVQRERTAVTRPSGMTTTCQPCERWPRGSARTPATTQLARWRRCVGSVHRPAQRNVLDSTGR